MSAAPAVAGLGSRPSPVAGLPGWAIAGSALPLPAAGSGAPQRHAGRRAERVALADGRVVTLRPVHAGDSAATQRYVRTLSPGSRHARFHIALHELPPSLLRLLTEVDQRCHVALVALASGEGEGDIIAEARYVMAGAGEAEFALSVADAWQGRGLGSALLRRLQRHAARRGVRSLLGEVLRSNAPMLSLLRRAGARFGAVPGTALLTRATLELQRAGPAGCGGA